MTTSARALFLLSIALLSGTLFAQMDPMNPPASQTQPNVPQHAPSAATSMQNSGGIANDTIQSMQDKTFLRKAAERGIAEVELGKLAVQKAADESVKAFGQRMIDDHTELNKEIASVADSLGIRLPHKMGKESQAVYDRLNSLSGEEFDREYISTMLKDHHEDLREFRMESNVTADPDLKSSVDKAAAVIRQHMIAIDRIARSKGIPMPRHGSKPEAAPPPAS